MAVASCCGIEAHRFVARMSVVGHYVGVVAFGLASPAWRKDEAVGDLEVFAVGSLEHSRLGGDVDDGRCDPAAGAALAVPPVPAVSGPGTPSPPAAQLSGVVVAGDAAPPTPAAAAPATAAAPRAAAGGIGCAVLVASANGGEGELVLAAVGESAEGVGRFSDGDNISATKGGACGRIFADKCVDAEAVPGDGYAVLCYFADGDIGGDALFDAEVVESATDGRTVGATEPEGDVMRGGVVVSYCHRVVLPDVGQQVESVVSGES